MHSLPNKRKKKVAATDNRQSKIKLRSYSKQSIIREVNYPEWLANVIMVRKSNEKWNI